MRQMIQIGGRTLYVSEDAPEEIIERKELFEQYPDLLTPLHIAEITGQCQATIRSLCVSQALPAIRIGPRWYVPKPSFIEYVQGGRINASQ